MRFPLDVEFLIIAVVVYKKKHVETAGDIITVQWMKPVFRWGTAVCTSSLGALCVREKDLFYQCNADPGQITPRGHMTEFLWQRQGSYIMIFAVSAIAAIFDFILGTSQFINKDFFQRQRENIQ